MAKPRTALDLLAEDEARTIRVAGARALSAEKRSEVESKLDRPSMRLLESLGSGTSSGAAVSETVAATVPTFNACAGLLSDMIGMLPCKLYRKTPDGREEQPQHSAARLIGHSTGQHQTPFELRQQTQQGPCYGGNGYIRVWRDSLYDPQELEWLKPCDVNPVKWRQDGRARVSYEVDGVGELLSRADIIHVRSLSSDGVKGVSPVRMLRESLGLSVAQRTQTGKLISNGVRFPGILNAPPQATPQVIESAREEWAKRQEGASNAGRTPVLKGDWKYQAVQGMSMADAEFLESRKFERTEIATLFRVPEVLLGNSDKASSWGTGIETLTNGFLAFSLNPWLVNWEQALNFTLLTEQEKLDGFYFRFTREALLQVAKEAQAKFFREMRDIGVYSVNDVRAKLEENDLPDHIGDDYRLPFNGSGGRPAEPSGKNKPSETVA